MKVLSDNCYQVPNGLFETLNISIGETRTEKKSHEHSSTDLISEINNQDDNTLYDILKTNPDDI